MFHRLIVDDWQRLLSIAMVIASCAMLLLTFARVMRMPRRKTEHLQQLPLLDESHD